MNRIAGFVGGVTIPVKRLLRFAFVISCDQRQTDAAEGDSGCGCLFAAVSSQVYTAPRGHVALR